MKPGCCYAHQGQRSSQSLSYTSAIKGHGDPLSQYSHPDIRLMHAVLSNGIVPPTQDPSKATVTPVAFKDYPTVHISFHDHSQPSSVVAMLRS